MKINFLLIGIVFLTANLFAQTEESENSEVTENKKRVNLSFRLDYGTNNQPAFIKTRYFYEGESYTQVPNDEWIWTERDRPAYSQFNDEVYKQNNIKFDLMLSLTQQLNIGLSYKVLTQRFEQGVWGMPDFISSSYAFFSISGTVDYEWPIPKVKNLYLNPTVSIGGFQDDYLYGRTGANLYYDAKLALFYRLFDRLAIRAWASYDHFLYRNKKESEVFPERQRIEKLDFQFINYGLGLSYRFFIYPD